MFKNLFNKNPITETVDIKKSTLQEYENKPKFDFNCITYDIIKPYLTMSILVEYPIIACVMHDNIIMPLVFSRGVVVTYPDYIALLSYVTGPASTMNESLVAIEKIIGVQSKRLMSIALNNRQLASQIGNTRLFIINKNVYDSLINNINESIRNNKDDNIVLDNFINYIKHIENQYKIAWDEPLKI